MAMLLPFRRLFVGLLLFILYTSSAFAAEHPRIGVSGQSAQSPSVISIMALLRFAGAEPVYFGDHAGRNPAHDLETVDAVIVAGNNYDIDPAIYHTTAAPETVNEMSKGKEAVARAGYEYSLIELALKQRIPLLGICGGMQRMNVGGDENQQGTLRQHVPNNNQWKKGIPLFKPSDHIRVVNGTLLSAMATQAASPNPAPAIWAENSLHHQAAERIRKGFRISARNIDGVVEAIEPEPTGPYGGQFALGVQWHPEYGASPLTRGIFEAFLDAAKRSH